MTNAYSLTRRSFLFFLAASMAEVCAFLAFIYSGSVSADEGSSLSNAEIVAAYEKWFEQLEVRPVLDTLGIPVRTPHIVGTQEGAPWIEGAPAEVVVAGNLEMRLSKDNLRPILIFNTSLFEWWAAGNREVGTDGMGDGGHRKNQIFAQADRIRNKLFSDRTPVGLSSNSPRFANEPNEVPHWRIRWQRMYREYPYERDGIEITLHDQLGFYACSEYWNSDECHNEMKLSRQEAQEAADRSLPDILQKWGDHLYTRKVAGIDTIRAAVVNPNRIYSDKMKTIDEAVNVVVTREARLAWVIEYALDVGATSKSDEYGITMWVDAETGEILGGDFTGR